MLPDLLAHTTLITAHFDKLGVMAWPLAVTAVIALAIIVERSVLFGISALTKYRHIARITRMVKDHAVQEQELRDALVMIELEKVAADYFSGLRLLKLIGTIAPLMGLMGTILGVISAFQVIAVHAGPVSPALIADGMWEAMMTTAAGLAIAMPVLIAEQLLRAGFSDRLEAMRHRLFRVSIAMEMQAKPPAPVSSQEMAA